MSLLNPVFKCGEQVLEVLHTHQNLSIKEVKREVLNLLEKVKLLTLEQIFHIYLHELL